MVFEDVGGYYSMKYDYIIERGYQNIVSRKSGLLNNPQGPDLGSSGPVEAFLLFSRASWEGEGGALLSFYSYFIRGRVPSARPFFLLDII